MHRQFLQKLELELEEILLSNGGLDSNKLKNILEVFDILKKMENAIKIYINFFCNEVKFKPISPNETDMEKYQNYLDAVHSDILARIRREFGLETGRLREGFLHRERFAFSLLSKYFSDNYKAFILYWLETDLRSKETFLSM